MSLQVWLALNGNNNNQGINEISMTGSPNSWGDGKIGKCATFIGNLSNVIFNNTSSLNYTDNFSWTIWIKTNFTGTVSQYAFTVGRADAGGYGYGLQCYSTTQCNIKFGSSTWGVPVTGGEWTHLAFTKSGNSIKIYKNGSIYSTSTFSGTLPTYSDGNGLGVGCFHYSGNIYPFYGSVNDFRIYDHCLSAREVKEIAKGLVLHYKLAGVGGENLLTGTGLNDSGWDINQSGGTWTKTVANDCTTFNVTALATSWFLYYHLLPISVRNSLKVNTIYTYSFEAKSTANFNLGISLLCGNGTNPMTNNKGVSIIGDNQWHQYAVQLTTRADFSTLTQNDQYFYMSGGNVISTVSFRNAKFEEGSIATPWCPNSADALYTTLGYNDGIEYDCSGYCRNGTKSGNITWDIDTPRYTTSYNFSPYATITTNTGFPVGSNTIFTFNIWLKVPSGKTMAKYGDYFSIKGSNLRVETSSTDGLNLYWFNYPIGTANGIKIENVQADSWYMHTLVCDGTKFYTYLNGKLKSTTTLSGTAFTTNGGLTLGDSSVTMYFNLADVRVYSTALSTGDIAELYNTSASIDKDGNLYAYELKEV